MGTIDTGTITVGDEVIFYPSEKKSKVKSIERFNAPEMQVDSAGSTTGFTLQEQIYVTRGELACKKGEAKPEVSKRIKTNLLWLGREDLNNNRSYFIKVGTQKTRAELEKVITVLDAATLSQTERQTIQRHEVAEVILRLEKEIAFDKAESLKENSRFVIVDNYEISGGGIIVDSLEEDQYRLNESTAGTHANWMESAVTQEERAVRYAQRPALILISGKKNLGQNGFAKYLERGLFREGRNVYYLDLSNVFQDKASISTNSAENRKKILKSLAKVSNILLHAGSMVIATIKEMSQEELTIITAAVASQNIKVLWLGDLENSNFPIDLHLTEHETKERNYLRVKKMLIDSQIIFEPYSYQCRETSSL